jgi:hypothetical protein
MNAELTTSDDVADSSMLVLLPAAAALVFLAVSSPGVLSAETGPINSDTGVTDTSVNDAGQMDASAGDVGPSDAATATDTSTDADQSSDVGADAEPMMPDAVASDAGGDAGSDAGVTGPARLHGRVDVRFADDDALVDITLTPQFASWSRSRTTGASGDFSFDGLPTGQYEVTFQRTDYVELGRTLAIQGDRVLNVSLFPDQNVQLRADARFDGDSAPSSVDFNLAGQRGDITPDDPISVQDGSAVWTRDDVPVGNWTLTATADGYLDASYELGIRQSAATPSSNNQVRVRLQMIPEDREADTVSTDQSGCGCRDEDSRGGGGGRIPGGFGPGALLLVGWLALRRLTR